MLLTDEIWQQNLSEALDHARISGRADLADFLSLKAANDAIREQSIKWLFDSVLEIVFAFNNHGARITIEQRENHKFETGKSKLTGSQLKLKQGVRCLSLEAGWTRNPGDGFMRGGALAFARINHFGIAAGAEELLLLKFEGVPQWFFVEDERRRASFEIRRLRRHFELLLDHK